MAKTDMGSFFCAESCPELCESYPPAESTFQLGKLYGLTTAERAIILKDPRRAMSAYKLSHNAERLCIRLYKDSLTNDESDACRHFVWASLLTRELGQEFANQVLNAHEQDAKQPEAERAMDLANNRQGQLSSKTFTSKTTDDEILKSFKENLKKGALVILKQKPTNKRETK